MSKVKHNYKVELPDGRFATRGTNREYNAILTAKVSAAEYRAYCLNNAYDSYIDYPEWSQEWRDLADSIPEDAVDYYLTFSWHSTRALADRAAKSNAMGSLHRCLDHQFSHVEAVVVEF